MVDGFIKMASIDSLTLCLIGSVIINAAILGVVLKLPLLLKSKNSNIEALIKIISEQNILFSEQMYSTTTIVERILPVILKGKQNE